MSARVGRQSQALMRLASAFITRIIQRYEGTRLGRQELHAELLTDVPGALWSFDTLLACRLDRAPDLQRVVVAVDPSSPFTGGALLGDRIRMQGFAGDDGVFIRSMASRGAMGGVARAAADQSGVGRECKRATSKWSLCIGVQSDISEASRDK